MHVERLREIRDDGKPSFPSRNRVGGSCEHAVYGTRPRSKNTETATLIAVVRACAPCGQCHAVTHAYMSAGDGKHRVSAVR